MSGKNFDVFISYRRSDGDAIARILNAEFALRDFRCFLDFDSLGGGKFDEKIEAAILDAPVFVMVLTPDYFSRCNDKGDWVRREIELALANNKIIVPINYDKNLNGIPDYLEEDFRERIGCHNFATVHKDDTFKSSFNQMVEERILKVVGKIVKQEHKAKVSVIADADCELIVDDEVIATVQKDKTNFILLEKGEHLIIVRSSEFPQIREDVLKIIDDVSAKYLIKVNLADRFKQFRNEIETKEKAEKDTEEAIIETDKAEKERLERDFEFEMLVDEFIKNGLSALQFQPYIIHNLQGHKDDVNSVTWSPDGKYLASGSEDVLVIIWDANSGERHKTLKGHSHFVWSVSWSPDGKYLASGSGDGIVIIWDANSGEKLQTLKGHSCAVWFLCWSPDGKYLASESHDNILKIWDVNYGVEVKTLDGGYDGFRSVCWSPDGKYFASGSTGYQAVIIWDAKSGEILKTLEGHSNFVISVCWSPDGKHLASGSEDKTIIIWDAKSGQRLQTLEGHSDWVNSVNWSPDGKYLASGAGDNNVIIWDANSGEKLKTLQGHNKDVTSVCWSPDGKYLASGSDDDTVKIWGVE
ncbi:MAG: TIR domain-containing protein [Bacteroidales bacterium]|nr:TIR domain-containing protein [Bacteroidales bacterium]